MKKGQKVIINWSKVWEGKEAEVLEVEGKIITVLVPHPLYGNIVEVEFTQDQLDVVEKEMTIIEKIQELFGENFVIKSKKVKELVKGKMVAYEKEDMYGKYDMHVFATDKKYKVEGAEFEITLRALQMKSGIWWVRD